MEDLAKEIEVEGTKLTLSDLAGLDMGGIDEVRGTDFPAGIFEFVIVADPAPSLDTLDVKDKESSDPDAKVTRPIIKFTMKCENVRRLPPKQLDGSDSPEPEKIIGMMYTESFFVSKSEDLGRVKAFLVDIGVDASKGSLTDLLTAAIDKKFVGAITKRRNKDDRDQIYTNLDRRKIEAITA
jgi:hypothetical protein